MIRIITDSTCDLSAERAKELGVDVMPLTVQFGQESYRDGVDLTSEAFYEKLALVTELPRTSQINPDRFVARFREYIEQGDEIVGIFISSELSGTYQSACVARDALKTDQIYLVDSRTVTIGLGLLVEEICIMRDEGLPAAEIAARARDLTHRSRVLAVVDTLKYLKMGGRISATVAVVGGLLGIAPIIAVQGRNVESVAKARGRKAAFQWIADEMKNTPLDPGHGVMFGHTNAPAVLDECRAFFDTLTAPARYRRASDIGSVVGTHVGPGAAGFAFISEKPLW